MKIRVKYLERSGSVGVPSSIWSLALLTTFLMPTQPLSADVLDCGGRLTPSDRMRCEGNFARSVQAASRISKLEDGWQLIRTPVPGGFPDSVSVLHAADTAKSDIGFAGMSFRCGQTGIESLLIMLTPLNPGSRYSVAISGPPQTQFEASALQGGEVLLLPPSATALARGSWQAISELSVEIAAPTPVRAVVPIGGLSGAITALSLNCTTR